MPGEGTTDTTDMTDMTDTTADKQKILCEDSINTLL